MMSSPLSVVRVACLLLAVVVTSGPLSAETEPATPTTGAAPTVKLAAGPYATLAEREQAVVAAALADLDAVHKSYSPMVGWTAQLLYTAGRTKEANEIVRGYVGKLIREAKNRIANMEKQKAAGTFKSLPVADGLVWGEPHVHGFGL